MGFFYVYIFRIYCGILFQSYDDQIAFVVESDPPWRKRSYVLLQFSEMSLCLSAPILFSAWSLKGGYVFLLSETALLIVFWAIFIKNFLIDPSQRRANVITLFLDVAAVAAPIIYYYAQDDGTVLGFLGAFLAFYLFFFLFEFAFVYVHSWVSFWRMTQVVLRRAATP